MKHKTIKSAVKIPRLGWLAILATIFLTLPLQAEEISIAPVQAQSTASQLESALLQVLSAPVSDRYETLSKLLVSLPMHARQLVLTALEAGYEDEEIIRQCLVSGSADTAISMLVAVLQQTEAALFTPTLRLAMNVLTESELDGDLILVESLTSGDVIVPGEIFQSCQGDCLRPFAQQLVDSLSDSSDGLASEVVRPEPALSGS
jgi:hypothetical protein